MDSITDTYNIGIKILGLKYIDLMKEDFDKGFSLLCNTVVPLKMVVRLYQFVVDDGDIIPIEKITQQEKQYLWNITNKCTCSKEKRFDLCKAIWLLKND